MNYKIRHFNKELRLLEVEFESGLAWAPIKLMYPFPKTKEELDEVIRPFLPHPAIVASMKEDASCLNFFDDMVGKEQAIPIVQIVKDDTDVVADSITLIEVLCFCFLF